MGQTLQALSSKKLDRNPIFKNRFCVEICEKVHTHYRNLRLVSTIYDWVNVAEGFKDALERWKARGCPTTRKGQHIELCRKQIVSEEDNDALLINLNRNLYLENKDSVYALGNDFIDPTYIHLKLRDVRVELSLRDFRELYYAIDEAYKHLKDSGSYPDL